jgi:hypothetical protein
MSIAANHFPKNLESAAESLVDFVVSLLRTYAYLLVRPMHILRAPRRERYAAPLSCLVSTWLLNTAVVKYLTSIPNVQIEGVSPASVDLFRTPDSPFAIVIAVFPLVVSVSLGSRLLSWLFRGVPSHQEVAVIACYSLTLWLLLVSPVSVVYVDTVMAAIVRGTQLTADPGIWAGAMVVIIWVYISTLMTLALLYRDFTTVRRRLKAGLLWVASLLVMYGTVVAVGRTAAAASPQMMHVSGPVRLTPFTGSPFSMLQLTESWEFRTIVTNTTGRPILFTKTSCELVDPDLKELAMTEWSAAPQDDMFLQVNEAGWVRYRLEAPSSVDVRSIPLQEYVSQRAPYALLLRCRFGDALRVVGVELKQFELPPIFR